MDIRRWDVWDMTVNLLNNSHKFQSADLVEKGVNWLLQSLVCDLKNVTDGNYNEVRFQQILKVTFWFAGFYSKTEEKTWPISRVHSRYITWRRFWRWTCEFTIDFIAMKQAYFRPTCASVTFSCFSIGNWLPMPRKMTWCNLCRWNLTQSFRKELILSWSIMYSSHRRRKVVSTQLYLCFSCFLILIIS